MSQIIPKNLTLYQGNRACSFVPHALLEDLGVPYSTVAMRKTDENVLEPTNGLTRDEYLAIHPKGYVPALTYTDDAGARVAITQMPAILRFLCELFPERELLGTTPLERARVEEWLSWLSGTVHGGAMTAFLKPTRFADSDDATVQELIKGKGRADMTAALERIEKLVVVERGEAHALPGRFSVVDIDLVWYWSIGTAFEWDMKKYPKFAELVQQTAARKGVQAIIKEEGVGLGI